MYHLRVVWFAVASLCLAGAVRADSTVADSTVPILPASSVQQTIAIADFTGADPEMGRFLSDTLLTDLAQSDHLQLVERTALRKALDELKLQSTGLFEPGQLEKLGKLVKADKIIVGSYFQGSDQLTINARLIDVETGRLSPGGGSNVTGDSHQMLTLIHRLAHLFHQRVTGQDFAIDGEGADRSAAAILPRILNSNLPSRSAQSGVATRPAVSVSSGGWRVSQTDSTQTDASSRAPAALNAAPPGYIVTDPGLDADSSDDSVSALYAKSVIAAQAAQASQYPATNVSVTYNAYPYNTYPYYTYPNYYPTYYYPTYAYPIGRAAFYGRSIRSFRQPFRGFAAGRGGVRGGGRSVSSGSSRRRR